MLAYRSRASFISLRLANNESASSKNNTTSPLPAASKICSRPVSVSPMYLLTTAERFNLNTSSPSSPATISAARVLPVPEGPEPQTLAVRSTARHIGAVGGAERAAQNDDRHGWRTRSERPIGSYPAVGRSCALRAGVSRQSLVLSTRARATLVSSWAG
jgi:hypothetical protein